MLNEDLLYWGQLLATKQMLAHLIHHKGKGTMILALPFMIAIVLFILVNDNTTFDRYIGAISIMLSSIICWFVDGGPSILKKGATITFTKGKNTLMWIELKYWAIVSAVGGCVWFVFLLINKG